MQCKNCQSIFTIYPEDRAFYGRIGVPEPTECPPCRARQRAVWRNEYILYQRKCDLCQQNIVSVYSPDKPYKVYCHECWFSDKWDGLDFGRDYDFQRGFFEQFGELLLAVPRLAINNTNSINSEYTHHTSRNKNCYLQFSGSTDCEDCLYGWSVYNSRDCLDAAFCYKSELCYECTDIENCYNCSYLEYSRDSADCHFCYDCVGCHNCFGCTNLRNQTNYLWNRQATEAEILEFKKQLASRTAIVKLRQKYQTVKAEAIFPYSHNLKTVKTTGDFVRYTKNCHEVYDIWDAEDCGFVINGSNMKDANDCTGYGGTPSQLAYQCASTGRGSYGTFFCSIVWESSHIWYSDSIFSSKEIFGSVGLKNQTFCLLNKKYAEADYNQLKSKIITAMKAAGEWGEFFPYALAPFGLNETRASLENFALTKEEVLKQGIKWQEEIGRTKGKETIKTIPDEVAGLDEKICQEILACAECSRNYKIIKPEFRFYQQQNIPLPDCCPDCRMLRRLKTHKNKTLYHRQCMKEGCANEFKTTYAPDRPEKVYCEECYRKEIY
ncbi:MAG: hypothetical protein WCT37_00520 [Patescibacteria group bacterium]|jgi:hypothetical protein